jgi:methyltransferase-like protein
VRTCGTDKVASPVVYSLRNLLVCLSLTVLMHQLQGIIVNERDKSEERHPYVHYNNIMVRFRHEFADPTITVTSMIHHWIIRFPNRSTKRLRSYHAIIEALHGKSKDHRLSLTMSLSATVLTAVPGSPYLGVSEISTL